MDQIAHLYKVTNLLTNEYYVGKHNGLDQSVKGKNKLYWGSGNRITNSIKKYGEENFKYEILCYGSSEYIFEVEKKYITDQLIKEDKLCLNLKAGGEGNKNHRQETIEKLRNRVITEETKMKLVESHLGQIPWNKGKKMSPEYCEKLKETSYWKNKAGVMTGKIHNEKTKEKMCLAWQKRKKEKRGLTSGYTFINNKLQTKLVSPEQLQQFLDMGWTKGMIRK
jgi:hypothetical protein